MGMDYGEIDFEMESDDDEIWSDPERRARIEPAAGLSD